MRINEVAKGCAEGRWFRHYGMYYGWTIRRNTEHYTPRELLGLYDGAGHYQKTFNFTLDDLLREDYYEVTEETANKPQGIVSMELP